MKHIVSVSGGKDSTATYCVAVERGLPFRAVAADTENEHPWTYEAIANLSRMTGGPVVEMVKADFTDRILGKRRFVETKWSGMGVPDEVIRAALDTLHPTGNAYLDLCIWKGRFPSRKVQFCTEELKIKPIDQLVTRPALSSGEAVVSWQGVRAAESFERSLLPRLQRLSVHSDLPGRLYAYRPLLSLTAEEAFAIGDRHGIPRNPLYSLGCNRVGCLPCVNASKGEIGIIGWMFPEIIEKLAHWERVVSAASKRGCATFFAVVNDPVMGGDLSHFAAMNQGVKISPETHGVKRMAEWAKTDWGGRQFNLFYQPEGTTCATHGACE